MSIHQMQSLYLESMVGLNSLVEELMAATGSDFPTAMAAIFASAEATRALLLRQGLDAYHRSIADMRLVLRVEKDNAAELADDVIARLAGEK